MNLTKRQTQAVRELRHFIPTTVDWKHVPRHVLTSLGVPQIRQSRKGIPSREAFFLKTDQGKDADLVRDVGRYAALLSAQRWMAAHEKMWREGFVEGSLHPNDFTDEPDHIFRLAAKAAQTVKRPFTLWKGIATRRIINRCKKLGGVCSYSPSQPNV